MGLDYKDFYHKDDLESQRKLFSICFPENVGQASETRDYYLWKFHSFPTQYEKSFEGSCYNQDELVGYYAALPFNFSVLGEYSKVAMVCDVMTHPLERGKGIFTGLGRYSLKRLEELGYHFAIGYPIRPEVIPGHLKVGWEIAFKLPLYIKVLKTDSLLSKLKLRWLVPLTNNVIKSIRVIKGAFSKKQDQYTSILLTKDELERSEEYNTFFCSWSKNIPIHNIKDRKFYLWRTGSPSNNYFYLSIKKDNNMVGFALSKKVQKKGIPCLAILDFMMLNEEKQCLGFFHKAIDDMAQSMGCEMVITMMSSFWAKRYHIIRSGFFRSPYSFSFIIYSLKDTIANKVLHTESNWHLMWVDSDDL